MKHIFAILTAMILLASCGDSKSSQHIRNKNNTETAADETVSVESGIRNSMLKKFSKNLNKENFTIIDFNATWCGPCRNIAPLFSELEKKYSDKMNFISIDVDQNPQLAESFKVSSIPTFVLIDSEGKELTRIIGADTGSLVRLIEGYCSLNQ
ncbi:MAG: thioredoxin family protein [Candidatus Amulumruptor caecigallinarius]|nr:thioredoxin family protein [Candidatus Amulumruptor caecigallinarius]